MRKADRLSKRYFRVCSWSCASANRRGAVLEKMVYDFDVVCLQETRTCPNRPQVLQDFTVIQRHEGRGMAIVVRSNLSKTVSLLNLDKWSTSSRELQGIRIEKPDERHKSLILINAYIHPSTCITGASWDFLEEMEDELGDTIMICGDFNARSSLWDQHGTNQQGCALEAALSDVLFTPVSTASPTHPGTRQGDTDSTIDLALVSPKLVPWTRAENLASHGSDHLPVVFSLQKPGIEQKRKLQYPFQYGKSDRKSDMGVMSKLRAHNPAHTTNPRQKAAIQPPWWNKETQAAWTDKRTMVKLWQKERSKPHPDLTIKARMEEKTEVFKRVASEAKDRQWKSFCDTLNRDTTLTHFWQFYRQMEGCAANTNTPDLMDASGSVLKTSKEKGSALLQRFVQQSNQNNLDERKAVLEGIHFDRMLTYKTQVESTKLRCKKGLSALKAMASKGIEQRHLFLLYQSVILSVIDYGLGLTTLSQSNLLKLDRVQNEAMRVILGTTKDTPIETMLYLLDLPSMETRHKVEQVKAYLNAIQNPKNPLHDAVKEEKGCRLARGKSWMGQAEQSIQRVCSLIELKQVRDWEKHPVEFKPYYKTLLS